MRGVDVSQRPSVASGAWDEVILRGLTDGESARAIRQAGGAASRRAIAYRRAILHMPRIGPRRWDREEMESLASWRGSVEEWAAEHRRPVAAVYVALVALGEAEHGPLADGRWDNLISLSGVTSAARVIRRSGVWVSEKEVKRRKWYVGARERG